MTENELQQLSKDVAKKYNIPPACDYGDICENIVYLHEDSARCFDLMVEHDVNIEMPRSLVRAKIRGMQYIEAEEYFNKHDDKHLATRVAILKALLAKD